MIEKLVPYKNTIKKFVPKAMRANVTDMIMRGKLKEIADNKRPLGDYPVGINMFGNMGGFSGLAEASRGLNEGFEEAGMPIIAYDFQSKDMAAAPYLINIIHTNPNLLLEVIPRLPLEQWKNHYNIGFWIWEQEKLPENWLSTLDIFDELWTASEFTANAIKRSTDKPVSVIPYVVNAPVDDSLTRKDFGLPEDVFLFLMTFDVFSVTERKNPFGTIEAFKKAFSPKDCVGMVIKIRNLNPGLRKQLKNELKEYPHVYILEGDYTKTKVNTLTKLADVVVSLHRAEGFGLVLAEAMSVGTPVIATNWSGNVDFMNDDVACMVDAKMIELDRDILPFKKGSRWADPDTDQAAGYMRKLYEDEKFRDEITANAREYISKRLSAERVSELIINRINEIKEIIKR